MNLKSRNSVNRNYLEEETGYTEPPNEEWRNFRDIIFMTVAYASNLGGTGTLTGTNPNLVLKGFLQRLFLLNT